MRPLVDVCVSVSVCTFMAIKCHRICTTDVIRTSVALFSDF